jgi:hypothetical protein
MPCNCMQVEYLGKSMRRCMNIGSQGVFGFFCKVLFSCEKILQLFSCPRYVRTCSDPDPVKNDCRMTTASQRTTRSRFLFGPAFLLNSFANEDPAPSILSHTHPCKCTQVYTTCTKSCLSSGLGVPNGSWWRQPVPIKILRGQSCSGKPKRRP